VNYALDETTVSEGLRIIADEVRQAYALAPEPLSTRTPNE
jgi:alanine-alpha-ketoisovalerate/valine-pyruvate aminotransferase